MPNMLSDEKRRAIQDAIVAGTRLMDIREQLSTSAMTISAIKREMGLPMRKRKTAPEATTPTPTVMHHRDIPRHSYMESYLERVKELEKPRERDFATSPEDITSEDVQPAPVQAYTPQEYFEAIADGLRQRDMENNTLKLERDRLRVENLNLLSDLNQCKLQMAQQWSGPAILPNRVSLGNGG